MIRNEYWVRGQIARTHLMSGPCQTRYLAFSSFVHLRWSLVVVVVVIIVVIVIVVSALVVIALVVFTFVVSMVTVCVGVSTRVSLTSTGSVGRFSTYNVEFKGFFKLISLLSTMMSRLWALRQNSFPLFSLPQYGLFHRPIVRVLFLAPFQLSSPVFSS